MDNRNKVEQHLLYELSNTPDVHETRKLDSMSQCLVQTEQVQDNPSSEERTPKALKIKYELIADLSG